MSTIDNPFDAEAVRLMNLREVTEEVARNVVILKYLKAGDTRPLAYWLPDGLTLHPDVRVFLSAMLQPERMAEGNPEKAYSITPEQVPYALRPVRRDGQMGRPRDMEVEERARAVCDYYDMRMVSIGRGGHDAVITEITDIVKPYLSRSWVLEVVKERSRERR